MKTLFTCAFLFSIAFFTQGQNPAYVKTTIVSGMQYPVAFDIMPNGNFICTMKGGNQYPAVGATILMYDPTGVLISTFYNLTDSVNADFERGLLGIQVDPNFNTTRHVYVYYNHRYNGDERIRVVRFTENANVGTNPFIVFDWDVPNNIPGNHVGGNIRMHASEPDKIYIGIGDLASSQSDTNTNYARVITNPYGKFLRIKTDGTIPTDNPFYDDGNPLTGNCDLIWTYGHRNNFDMCFSPVNDSLYSTENGWNTWDEANIIMKGQNYGWNVCEGSYMNSSNSVPCNNSTYINPLTQWGAPLYAVTGILIYSGTVFPTFNNHMLVADNDQGRMYDITLGNAPYYNTVTSNVFWADMTTTGGLTTLKQGSDGCIYAMKGGYTTNGQIYRICPQGLYVGEGTQQDFFLNTPFPNPASGSTTFNYQLKQDAAISLTLYDISGREIGLLVNDSKSAGNYSYELDAQAMNLGEGTYFCTLRVGSGETEFIQTVRFVLVN